MIRHRGAWLASALIVALFYFWVVGIAGEPVFNWSHDLDGYYDLLGRAFAGGQLYLPVAPRPELLALPDPWDDNRNKPYRLLDAALYQGRYYLYHGAAPALLLFTPWRLLTRHDLPERLATLLLCLGGYLFLCELLTAMLSSIGIQLSWGLSTLLFLALGLGQPAPFLLNRVRVYEVAIAAGYFCLSAGFCFFFKALAGKATAAVWAGLSGLFFGFAAGCRPHLGLAAVPVFTLLLIRQDRRLFTRQVLAFALPVVACALSIAAYNYARFGNLMEFGLRYQLGDSYYRNIRLSFSNVLPGLYYLLAAVPDLVAEFPFFRLERQPFILWNGVLPPHYFLEPIAGALAVCPLLAIALPAPVWIRRLRPRSTVSTTILALYLYSIGCVLFIAATALSSQRFEVDFLPFLLVIACVLAAERVNRFQGAGRRLATSALAVLILYGIIVNAALASQGQYDQFVQAKPEAYVALARWFSPRERFRPVLNPRLEVEAYFDFPEHCPLYRLPLMSAGEFGSRYVLSAECVEPDRVRLISETAPESPNIRTVDVPLDHPGLNNVALEYTPGDRTMRVRWNGAIVLQHRLSSLVTARSQIHLGWDPIFGSQIRFNRRILNYRKPVFEVSASQ